MTKKYKRFRQLSRTVCPERVTTTAMSITRRKFGIITAGIAVAVTDASNAVCAAEYEVERMGPMAPPRVLGPSDSHFAILGGTNARFIIEGEDAGKRFSLVEHPMQPRALAAPMHRHHREDEYSFVLEGSIGALLGDSVVIGNPGDLIFKPREQWHTFWNAGDAPARVLEIISPAGFENYFRELGAALVSGPPDPQRLAALCARYALDMDMSSVPGLIQRFGVRFPGGPPPAPR
jgi:mannose-6-phosphate isomerase-like protein (cupin superfamily)